VISAAKSLGSIVVCTLVLFSALTLSCTKKGSGERGGRGGRGGRDSGPVAVKVSEAKLATASRSVSIVSPLEGRSQADVYAKVTGRLQFMGPKEGAAVNVGEILFRVDRSDPGESFLNMPVVSPIKGWIGRWTVTNIGAQINAQTPVVTVVDDSYLRATVYLSTAEWVVINDQAKVSVTVGDVVRQGQIVSVARAADAISGRGSAIVEVENQNHDWRVGMIGRIEIELEPKPRMLISAAALNITDQGAYVFVVESAAKKDEPEKTANIARKKVVNYLLIDSDTVEVVSGIEDGSRIVVAGGNYLTEGSEVNVVGDDRGSAKAKSDRDTL
jgi:multidrug efflux pump subunit AcrA (membrane-fusion protein)